MSDTWYYAEADEPVGPISHDELKGLLAKMKDWRTRLVWSASLNEWREAGTISELDIVEPPPIPKPSLRRVIILVAVIMAVPVMMWTITIFIHSYVPKTPTFRHLTLTEPLLPASLPPKPQAAQRAPAPLLTDTARTAGDGLASLPDPNNGSSLRGPAVDALPPAASPTGPADGEAAAVTNSPQSAATAETVSSEAVTPEAMRGLASRTLALPPAVDAPPPAASPTGPAETAPNARAVASGEAAAVANSAQSAARVESASREAVTPVQRDRLTPTAPVTASIAPVSPVPLPRVRPVDAPVDRSSVPSSPPSGSPLLAHPADYGYQPGLDSAH